ncbi:cysteine methyltransferase [Massilia sp. WF1]|uniref:methylated-DNA--[protein]-cysteine S-methyltransferase n=1 Tax=unclassified Massilia TaxID=2609279 RepID=UPI0006494D41|nr:MULTISPECIES: methylated-DNA--[protein]-cysteine S-methyltransferase [unclassified Massilia]ALK98800.1 cysteine methyltransferase [Massilia sp. WG5]KLU38653.1 cysteine methyltransferase [Massilia sp. WF1]
MNTQQGSELFSAIVAAPFGAMGIRTEAQGEQARVRELVYLPPHYTEKAPQDAAAEQAAEQVTRYFGDADFRFELPLVEAGSVFQRRVWDAIQAIPRGKVLTYGQVAKLLESHPRAVGQACGANWFPLVIPCHRVTASGGLGGFASSDDEHGFTLTVKRWLLRHEGALPNDVPWQQQSIFP